MNQCGESSWKTADRVTVMWKDHPEKTAGFPNLDDPSSPITRYASGWRCITGKGPSRLLRGGDSSSVSSRLHMVRVAIHHSQNLVGKHICVATYDAQFPKKATGGWQFIMITSERQHPGLVIHHASLLPRAVDRRGGISSRSAFLPAQLWVTTHCDQLLIGRYAGWKSSCHFPEESKAGRRFIMPILQQ